MKTGENLTIGFIGQGFIGKNYADDFERRGYSVVRYALEEPHRANKDKIKECDVVFVAVPTPTTQAGFDAGIVEGTLSLVGDGKIAIIKSTILPGTTAAMQQHHPHITLMYSPEFLSERTAAHDAANPFSNIVGMAADDETHRSAAEIIHSILPSAPYSLTCTSSEAEIIKYTHNGSGYVQIIFFNLMYDLAQRLGFDWNNIGEALKHDPMISNRYSTPVHQSGHPGAKPGRGAGGHCFIKDMAALRKLYERSMPEDIRGIEAFLAFESKNVELLTNSGKDLDLLAGVYGGGAPTA